MKILHISTSDTGGAGIAALRLHQTLFKMGCDSWFLCLNKTSQQANVVQIPKYYPRFYHRFFSKLGFPITIGERNNRKLAKLKKEMRAEMFSFPISDYQVHNHNLCQQADVIIIHWVAGFLNFKTFFRNIPENKKIYWYTHDFNCILGGFHTLYDDEHNNSISIKQFEQQLKTQKQKYLSQNRELRYIANSDFTYKTLVSVGKINPSIVDIVKLGVPINELTKIDKHIAKKALGIDENQLVILTASFSLTTGHKGFDRLERILTRIKNRANNLTILTLGQGNINQLEHCRIIEIGSVWNPMFKSIVFSAADFVVSTSYEETFGQTIIEGYACGTPAIVFNNAALPESVKHLQTGYIANTEDEFAEFLIKASKMFKENAEMGEKAFLQFQQNYTSEIQVNNLLKLVSD